MKIIKKSLLVAAISTAIAGCGDESFKPEVNTSNVAPVVPGNIEVSLHEKDAVSFAYLLGAASGEKTGEGVVTDADGDFLSVKNLTSNVEGSAGFELEGNTLLIRPSALMDSIDTGEIHTIVFTYDISDGTLSTPRTATFHVTGEDFAPEITGDLVGNFTKDAGTGTLSLLTNVVDADNEPLTASNLVADAGNAFVVPTSINENNELVLDIASVSTQVADGEKVTLNYTYQISDHRFDANRNLEVNILGVKDVPGAPLIGSYFLNDEVNETDTSKVYDLTSDVVDREGDAISVKNVKLNGEDLATYGATLEGNNLTFSPNAFLSDIAAGANMTFEFTYQIEDVNGNTSDGERLLSVIVNGVESNVLVTKGASVSFETDTLGSLPSDWVSFGWEGTGAPEVTVDAAHTGTNGVSLNAGVGMVVNWTSEMDRIYYYAGWSKTDATNGNANFPVHFNAYGNGAGRAWWDGGNRQWVADTTVWAETATVFNTFSFGWAVFPDASFQVYNGPAASHSTVVAHVDDIRIVDITDIDGYANNMLAMNADSFEDGIVPANNDVGTVGLTDVATEVTNGMYALTVDTTGNATASEVVLPVQAGAVKTGGRYMLQLDIHATNAPADAATGFEVKLETANGEVYNFYPSTWSNEANSGVRVMLNTDSATGSPDWENEDVSVRLRFQVAGIVYHIDNVTLFAIP
jgi:hypothetical protein